jgi:hypothetical protein
LVSRKARRGAAAQRNIAAIAARNCVSRKGAEEAKRAKKQQTQRKQKAKMLKADSS